MSLTPATPPPDEPTPPASGMAVGIGSSELVLLRDWHVEKARVLTSIADDCRRDLDRIIADNECEMLLPGRWPAVLEHNERQIAFDREQAAEHTRYAATAEAARRGLLSVMRESLEHGEHNPISGKTLLPQGYQKIHRIAESALQNAVVSQPGQRHPSSSTPRENP